MCVTLKGVCHEIFDPQYFPDSHPSESLINRLKFFEFCFYLTEIFVIINFENSDSAL